MRAVFFAPALLAAGVTACGSGASPELPGGQPRCCPDACHGEP